MSGSNAIIIYSAARSSPQPLDLCLLSPAISAYSAACYWEGPSELPERWSSSSAPRREENGNPLQYPCLENPTDRGAWQATAHEVTMNRTAKDGEALYSQQKQDQELTVVHHELLIAKFRLKLKKVGKTTKPFRYDLSFVNAS